MAAGIKTPAFDGVGYDVGAPSAAAGGFLGLLDFAGYPVGAPPGVIPPEPPPAAGGSIPISIDPVTWEHEVGWSFRVDWRAESRLRRGQAPARKRDTPEDLPVLELLEAVVVPAAQPITWSTRGPTLEVRIELRGAVTFRSRLGAIVEDDEELFELGLFDDSDE